MVMTIPRIFAQFLVNNAPCRYLELPFDVPNLETYLYWHESTDKDQANQWMRDLVLTLPSKLTT